MAVVKEGFMLQVFKTIPAFMKTLIEGFHYEIEKKKDPVSMTIKGLNKSQKKTMIFLNMEGGATLSDIAKVMNLERGSVTTLVDSLEEMEFVRREKDPNDRRKMVVYLTEKGNTITELMCDTLESYVSGKLSMLTDEEVTKLKESIHTMASVVEKLRGEGNG